TLTETQPAGFLDGRDTHGTPGSAPGGDGVLERRVWNAGVSGANNNFGELAPASLSGFVYRANNDNGVFEPGLGEAGIAGVTVTLTGTDDLGAGVNLPVMTNGSGAYSFGNLRPSNAAGYTITESQPAGFLDGRDTIGTPGGTPGND